jgi:glycosyltransferase involved in cell wall biosynthesis
VINKESIGDASELSACALLHHPKVFASRSGLYPLVEALGASPLFYDESWRKMERHSWTAGQWLRKIGNRYYGSTWNSLVPIIDEFRLSQALPDSIDLAHFLWGEFASPVHPRWFRKRARALVGTFHASARRLPLILKGFRSFKSYDFITLMSESQRPYFIEQGVPEDCLRVILHGVDSRHFTPPHKRRITEGPLRGLMVGSTERDHEMMNAVLKKIPADVLTMTILTAPEQKAYYYGDASSAQFPRHLSDQQLICAYQDADVLVMPMLDCTANNAVLESMSCGTPVMVNRVGGISEYVDPTCNIVLDQHAVDSWVDRLCYWHAHREQLEDMRPRVRQWAESFDWHKVAPKYLDVYKKALTQRQ